MTLTWEQLVEKCVNKMKNLKEIKLMMERLESPRLTDTELQRKKSILKEEEGQNKMASEEQLEFMVDRIPATLSVKGVSNYELEKLISQNKMKMNFMNGVIAWVDKDSKLYQMGKILKKNKNDLKEW